MSEELPRLVLRRTEKDDQNKIAVRLAPDIDRTADLYELFSEGIIIEIIDVQAGDDENLPEVALGLSAPEAFRFDRTGRLQHPRRGDMIGEEESLEIAVASDEEIDGYSLEELGGELARAKTVAQKLRAQYIRLKRDRSKAIDRGYKSPKDNRHHEWLMLIEEMDIVSEQMRVAETYAAKLSNVNTCRWQALKSKRRDAFENQFIRLVKERLPKKEFLSLRDEAQRLAEESVPEEEDGDRKQAIGQ